MNSPTEAGKHHNFSLPNRSHSYIAFIPLDGKLGVDSTALAICLHVAPALELLERVAQHRTAHELAVGEWPAGAG